VEIVSPSPQSFGGRVESGYRVATFYGGITPYAAIQAQSFHTPDYSESDLTGGGFALAYNARTASDTRSELGARFDRLLLLNPDAALTMRARIAWAHDWISDPTLAALFQTLPGASFVVNGATPAKNSALASAGAEAPYRQRRHPARQVRRRIRLALIDRRRHRHHALHLVIYWYAPVRLGQNR
jgi:outer membrane autotransporter protein